LEIVVASVAQIRKEYQKKRWSNPLAPASSKTVRLGRRELEDQLAGLKRENDDLNRAMYEAAQIQRRLCGPRHFRTGGYEFASEIFPLRHLSGDFISVMQLEGDLVFIIGDIAGKGLMAGMWFTHMVGMIRREVSVYGDPAAAVASVDRNLLISGVEFPLTTLFLARLNPGTGELTYCNAGHPPALLIRDDGDLEELNQGGRVLGVISGSEFVNGRTKLSAGSTLLAYSDGIAECRNESGVEFGAERLLGAVRAPPSGSPSAMLFSVLASVENFAGSRHREDDIALIILRRLNDCELDMSERGGSKKHAA
jgi:sigma-B regulation protein RsbU (phosphoserine phosphatase)